MKNRFNLLDLRALINELKSFLIGSYIKNVYSDKKSFVIRFNNRSLLIEPGVRMHLVNTHESGVLSHFASVMRKLNRQKLKEVSLCGFDRIALLDFSNFKLYLEFFSHGNIIMTDNSDQILELLRTVPGICEKGQVYIFNNAQLDLSVSTLLKVPFNKFIPIENILLNSIRTELRNVLGLDVESFKVKILDYVKSKSKVGEDSSKESQADSFQGPEKCKSPEGAPEIRLESLKDQVVKNLSDLCLKEGDSSEKKAKYSACAESEQDLISMVEKFDNYMKSFLERIQNIKNFGIVLFKKGEKDSFFPMKVETESECRTFECFSDACLFYFANKVKKEVSKEAIIEQKQKLRIEQLRESVEEHKQKATILRNSQIASKVLQTFEIAEEQRLNWDDFFLYKKKEDEKKNEVSLAIKKVDFVKKTAIIEIEGREIEIIINKNIYYNASRLYEKAKMHESKIKRTEEALKGILERARKKQKAPVCTQKRKLYWFEKFHFVVLPGKIILSGKNAQQNEILVKKFLNKFYFHCNVQGGSSVILEDFDCEFVAPLESPNFGKGGKAVPAETDPVKLAAEVALCMSKCWSEKVARSVFYVNADQVSKSAPTGEYLTKGSFIVRGKKNIVEVFKLEYSVGIIFRLSCEHSEVKEDDAFPEASLLQAS